MSRVLYIRENAAFSRRPPKLTARSAAPTTPSLLLALRIADYFGLPVEAVFSLRPFAPLSEIVYRPAVVE